VSKLPGSIVLALALAVGAMPAGAAPRATVALAGVVSDDAGAPVGNAVVVISSAETGDLVDAVTTDKQGRYHAALAEGDYALAVANATGYAWVDKVHAPDAAAQLTLKTACHRVTGHVTGDPPSARVNLERQTSYKGDTFMVDTDRAHSFTLCLPDGRYRTTLLGKARSARRVIDLDAPGNLQIESFPLAEIKRAPVIAPIHAELQGVVDDIVASDPQLIGLGEATHGTAELTTARGELTFALIRQAKVRLLLFEFDAVASGALDDYINGGNVDLDTAVPALGFWITDTYEFHKLLDDLRAYNAAVGAVDKVHLVGIDAQNTTPPVETLLASARELGITAEDQAVLGRMTKRAKAVRDLAPAERTRLDSLLVRLAAPRSMRQHDFLIALAAKSLAIQLDYWTGDMAVWYRKRRNNAMAELIHFVMDQLGAKRAVLWAHAAHITREPGDADLGAQLAVAGSYYAVGFYLYQGSARAWDQASKIGVIPHAIAVAPPSNLEAVVMRAAGMPDIAWLALKNAPTWLAQWLKAPRYVRELYATFLGDDASQILRDIRAGFDAVAILQRGHDSSPTPTGVRTAEHK
jgi:erythromycin esterase